MRIGRQTERLPHVHDRQPNARTLPLAEPSVKLAHARLRAVLAAEPDRPTANKVTDHDPVAVAFADRNLVNPDHLRTRRAHALELSFHVLLVQRLDRVPVQRQFLRHVLDRRPSAPPHGGQPTRRTSNPKNIRVSPHERSRTRRTFRSYQPIWT